jgi:3-deoxy-manno-octulosonate cytidylyltransferase (CMP-KDO synthetase)
MLSIIPARFASTRFPGKPLVMLGEKTMLQRVYEQVAKAQSITKIVVATDDVRIFDHARSFGADVVMTRPEHPSGTDRCAEVAALFPNEQFVINIQGDEPFIQPEQIDLLCATLEAATGGIATLAKKINNGEQLFDPNCVKVAIAQSGEALYFSRHPIPYLRGTEQADWLAAGLHHKHIGLYGFARETLLEVAALSPSDLEKAESLEQLRWLEHGYRIRVAVTDLETIGIDTPADLERVAHLLAY